MGGKSEQTMTSAVTHGMLLDPWNSCADTNGCRAKTFAPLPGIERAVRPLV
jgi:hypothetical protein